MGKPGHLGSGVATGVAKPARRRGFIPPSERPSWLPDWRDPANYPGPKTRSLPRWWWEFQRRDPAYWRDWAERADRSASFWREQYGIPAPLDPASPTVALATDRRWLIVPPQTKEDQTCEITIRAGTALVEINLTRPLEPQLKSVALTLQAWMLEESDLTQPRIEAGFLVKKPRR